MKTGFAKKKTWLQIIRVSEMELAANPVMRM